MRGAEALERFYDYDISVIVKKQPANRPGDLHFDEGDIEKLSHLFPFLLLQGFDGRIGDLNW